MCHFNENVFREQQKALDGSLYFNVIYPKYKLGDEVVREVAIPPTYSKYKCVTVCFEQNLHKIKHSIYNSVFQWVHFSNRLNCK